MSLRDDKLYRLELKLRKAARVRDPADERAFTAHVHGSGSCVIASWHGTGACWKKMVGSLDALVPGSETPTSLSRSQPYTLEAAIFFTETGNPPDAWALTGLSWADQLPGDYVAKVRVTKDGTALSAWENFGEGPRYSSSNDVAKDITRHIAEGRSSQAKPFGLGMVFAAALLGFMGYGAYDYLGKNPGAVERVIETLKDQFPTTAPAPRRLPEPNAGPVQLPDQEPELSRPRVADDATRRQLERALSEAERRNAQLDAELDRKNDEINARRRDLATVRTRAGLNLPPCWPDITGNYVDFLFNVEVSDAGIEVSRAFPARRDIDYGTLPVSDAGLETPLTRGEFIEHFRGLYDLSREQTCRHYVHLLEGEHTDLNTYKVQRDTVEGYFYIHRPKWNK